MVKLREPCAAGSFYPADEKQLFNTVKEYILAGKNTNENAKGIIVPHAGYIYSGKVAIETIASFELGNTIIILGPNHSGLGKDFSLSGADAWDTPFGRIDIDKKITLEILKNSKYIQKDDDAHRLEHSIEVQLPLLQYVKKNFKIVPIIVLSSNVKAYEDIGLELASIIKSSSREITIIASTDLTHYEPQDIAQNKDKIAIDAILELNVKKLIENIKKLNISMCGYAPTSIMIETVKNIGTREAKLIKYQTSGDTTGDYTSVVGYAGIGIF